MHSLEVIIKKNDFAAGREAGHQEVDHGYPTKEKWYRNIAWSVPFYAGFISGLGDGR